MDNAISMAKEMNYLFPQVYSYIFKAKVYYSRGRDREAMENLVKAFELALPDKIYLPFIQFTYMSDILTKANIYNRTGSDTIRVASSLDEVNDANNSVGFHEKIRGWKADIDNILTLYNRYHKGRSIILNAFNQAKSPLTQREREVAILAKARLSHKEIAEKLCISKATVRTILYNAYGKLGIHSKSELYDMDF